MRKISGKVIKGEGLGRILGYPTANLDRRGWTRLKQKPKMGIWAGQVFIHSKFQTHNPKQHSKSNIHNPKFYKAAIVIGPMDKIGLPKIEAHLLGFRGNLYGKKAVIFLHKFVRNFKRFGTQSELTSQIKKDITTVKNLYINA